MTRTGRMPPCSRPTRGPKSTSQTSPSLGARVFGTDLLLFRRRIVGRLVLEAIHGAARKESDLALVVCPGRRIRPQPGEVLMNTLPELCFLVLGDRILDHLADRPALFARQRSQRGGEL